ncbi:PAS domain S-box-containing protein [Arenibacter algicola]|uniref:histidine kinase n=1 Tax=Arenibacter algicola TaxID=616991 RepID=A0A221V176_9FLAO|nr:type IV pili methyl-accepting chemotaxis transducer N-terminal domain-containing protein [Arenibacter algicola]ASO07365.1 signal transduction histidine-protein kinase/phosphatase DegS [Arenibacter algicola]|tara:strand:+ start:28192 stop:30039 length:1848 start_codon:yes stop_codon:yes gene_type:complete
MNEDNYHAPLDTTTFLRIRKWYLLALAAIALSIVVAQILIQHHLNSQLDDSKVINVAGRQRAYSQKLTKEVLLLKELSDPEQRNQIFAELRETLTVWKESHQALQHSDVAMGISKDENEEVQELFHKINPHYDAMVSAVENILADFRESGKSIPDQLYVDILLENERTFLKMMDAIVNKYDVLSKTHLQNLKFKEYLLLAISLLILILEIFFIFKPLSLQIRNTIKNLIVAHKKSDENAKEIKKLFQEKEKSLQELQELNFVIDNAALFASAKQDGNVVFISKKFNELLGRNAQELNRPLYEILTTDEGQQQYLAEVLKSNRKNIRTEEIKIKTTKGESLWLDMSIIPMHQSSAQQSILILCSDITERKQNELKVAQLTQANYEETMRQKQLQASQIVEGQEEERKRIAKDIHDGIGQMLTALKFNIESINLSNKEKTAEKIEYIKSLASDLIKGVRTATFNLTPPELSDHGIFPALHKMTHELSKLTGKNILFENKTEENIRFNSLAETNIYRVVQEAVNNAIKYAEANYILVTINFNDNILSVVIDDDGKGFDDSILGKVPKNTSEGGMGLFFMKERMNYINGRLFINSIPGKGTRVTINYKTDSRELIVAEE